MADQPETARWLTSVERAFVEAKLRAERLESPEIIDKMDRNKFLRGMLNPVTLVSGVIFMFDSVTVQGLGFFTPTIICATYPDRTVVQQQLLKVPPYIVVASCFSPSPS